METLYKNNFFQGLCGKAGDSISNPNRKLNKLHKLPRISFSRLLELDNQDTTTSDQIFISSTEAITDVLGEETFNASEQKSLANYYAIIAVFLKAPHVEIIDIPNFNYWEDQSITVKATKAFTVIQVTIAIYNNYGNLMEKGNAQPINAGLQWSYNTTAKSKQLNCDNNET